jgi:hypothetical protein
MHNHGKGIDMKNYQATSSVLAGFFLAAMFSGCAVEQVPEIPDDDIDTSKKPPPVVVMDGPDGTNGMLPLCFWDHTTQSALRSIGATKMVDAKGKLRSMSLPLLCGHVVDYMVRCALPKGSSVTDATGEVHEGAYGLAPSWKTAPLDQKAQRWMTSCMIGHLNGLGQKWPILLSGKHAALVPDPDDDVSAYDLEESAAFGNLFTGKWSLLSPAFTAYVCTEQSLLDTCTLTSTVLSLRLCDAAPLCGLKLLGQCKDVCSDDGAGNWKCSKYGYDEVIRVNIRSDDVLLLCK